MKRKSSQFHSSMITPCLLPLNYTHCSTSIPWITCACTGELRMQQRRNYSSNFNVDSRTCACSNNNEHFSCVVRETVHITTNKPTRQLNIQKHTHRGKWDAISNCIWMSILGCVGICGRWLGQINTVKYYQQSLGTHNKVTYIHTLTLAVNKAKGKVKQWKAFRKQNIQLNV
jgi:hypothetical protein